METLLSLTSKRAGDWFKEELRLLGGLDHIVDKGGCWILMCSKPCCTVHMYTYATILFVTVCNCHMSCVLHCHSERVCWQPEPRGWQGEPCSIFMGGWEVSESAWKCKYSSVKLDSLLHQSHTRVSLKDNSNWVLSCELAGDLCYPIKCLCLKHWMCLYQLYLKMPFSFPS